ncbi:putative ATPase [Kutzneria buriramensis]|uniref:Putative ATPase n=1 Tax=Kutzneria buriramensis TaxID=1045776 RepID=A0A3E0I6R3_9PSEU|nr:putative ATPase [Kutzneria buriramensis]
MRRLEYAWRDTDRGRLVAVSGPAGVGKTRLCEEASVRAKAAGLRVLWGRCWSDGGAPALWPWQPLLAELCGPETAALLSSDAENVDPARFSRFQAVCDRLADALEHAPTMLVIDDLHAADPGALLLTRFIAKALHRLPLVLVVTHRPGLPITDLGDEALPIALRPFDFDETHDYLVTNGIERLDSPLTDTIHRLTDGSPLFLRRLVALGAADFVGGLREAIEQSFAQLTGETVRLLAVGAILGDSVSSAEVAALLDVRPAQVIDTVECAVQAGLVTTGGTDSFEFSHDLVRQAALSQLTGAELLDAHARAVDIVKHSARKAHHALNAAPRSAADARRAVEVCRSAAATMVRRFSYEQAASLLARAAEFGEPSAELLLEWANAVLASGRLAEARVLFDRAADAAQDERDPVLYAQTALGLGGIWLNERRDQLERHRMLGVQRKALAGLSEQEVTLRCRLELRLAAELVYSGGPVAEVIKAVDEIRLLNDDRALAEALSLCHHALLTPEHVRERLVIAQELMAVAAAAGIDILALQGLCWQTVDLFHLGDPRADRSLAELRNRADMLDCHSVRFIVAALDVMLLIRAGRLEEAEEQAGRCLALGNEVGDADAIAYYGAHLLAIRWLQGRGAELLDLAVEMANSPTLIEAEFTFRATVAHLAADAGRHDQARSALARLTVAGMDALPRSSTWLSGMLAIVESAASLGDADVARQAYDLLLPFAEQPTMPSLGVVCFGSTERTLGIAAATFGDLDRAVGHLRRAVATNQRLGNRPMTACSKADLATVLRRQGEHRAAEELLDSAVNEATAMGMRQRATAWAAGRTSRHVAMRRQDTRWLVGFPGREVLVDDLIGMQHLARLLAHPDVSIPAVELAHGGAEAASDQSILDDRARAAYLARANEIAGQIPDAEPARAEELRRELDALAAELDATTGLGGRSRSFTGPAERARTSVRKAIKRAVDVIRAVAPEVAAVLDSTISTGFQCVYTPDR